MLLFCPNCANALTIKKGNEFENRWACQTCPYEYPIKRQLLERKRLPRKKVDDVMGGEDSWKNVDSTEAVCPKCEHGRAYFMQIQIRSADEPMTTFYKCCSCGEQWREN
ncbi:putative Rpc11-DNA-directed RNA polymerase III subunit C11 [Tilletiaria anomala UBC 951]|uniref:DNA-directed RNA polymerase subunit n=1 Tax=Tilletiaria anomala (strain ATCC 24038 / CBS 436.72 / UBC 951) TaxID=1037660 RepID=A0A066VIB1_TILAU|nr:putative Rpc11-DNA-directed RNA polymerase III subunit C11 [Tilletiaria anomala UBC 951]KDN41241.1 putative Rpc11-DNA-directed RNA polymerase III subunit C11 [Tilletiaria anomala UBC 951]